MSSTSSNDNPKTVQAYNDHLQAYIDDQPKDPSLQLQEYIRKILQLSSKPSRILELGSGPGRDAQWIENQGFKVDCTDASKAFVDYMQNHGLRAKLLDVLRDDYPNGYDLIYASALLVHFDDAETVQILVKCHSALNDNGILAIRTKEGNKAEWTTEKMGAPRFMRYWVKSDLENTIKQAGFRILSSYSTSGSIDYRGVPWIYVIAQKA